MTEKNNYQVSLIYPTNHTYVLGPVNENINSRIISGNKKSNEDETVGTNTKKFFFEDASGYAPDMVAPETIAQQEDIKTDDEEIKYYSLRGDNHYDDEDASWK